jgi:CHAD domain-containing protein
MVPIRETVERELKLLPGDEFHLPELGGEAIEPRLFVSTYHDTADHRLARRGVTLRHRDENGKGLWQLKLPHGQARLELEQAGAAAALPDDFVSLLMGHLRGEPLTPIARLRTRREGVRANGAEIVHDTVAVLDGRKVTRSFEELEVELLDGDEKTLRRLERALRKAGAARGDFRPKVFQALDLDFEPEPEDAGTDGSPSETLRRRLLEQAGEVLAHDPGTRLGTDSEELYKMRVATRRLRAFLRAGRELLDPAWAEPVREELRWLGTALGSVRDLDVLIEHLTPEIESLGRDEAAGRAVLRALERERRAARKRLLRVLSGKRYFALLDVLESPVTTGATEPTLEQVHEREHAKLRKAVKKLGPDSSDEELHAARIKTKRARYAAELIGADAYLKAAKTLQDVLGEHQDAVVAQERLRALGERVPEAAVAAGRLVEREAERAERGRTEWQPAWKQLKKTA